MNIRVIKLYGAASTMITKMIMKYFEHPRRVVYFA